MVSRGESGQEEKEAGSCRGSQAPGFGMKGGAEVYPVKGGGRDEASIGVNLFVSSGYALPIPRCTDSRLAISPVGTGIQDTILSYGCNCQRTVTMQEN